MTGRWHQRLKGPDCGKPPRRERRCPLWVSFAVWLGHEKIKQAFVGNTKQRHTKAIWNKDHKWVGKLVIIIAYMFSYVLHLSLSLSGWIATIHVRVGQDFHQIPPPDDSPMLTASTFGHVLHRWDAISFTDCTGWSLPWGDCITKSPTKYTLSLVESLRTRPLWMGDNKTVVNYELVYSEIMN